MLIDLIISSIFFIHPFMVWLQNDLTFFEIIEIIEDILTATIGEMTTLQEIKKKVMD